MQRAVVSLSPADLLSHAGAGSASFGTVDNVALRVGAPAVVFVEVLRTHDGNLVPRKDRWTKNTGKRCEIEEGVPQRRKVKEPQKDELFCEAGERPGAKMVAMLMMMF
ncbi:hypothetical protein BJX96DRAFT_139093 [Aspergillus floccosus]